MRITTPLTVVATIALCMGSLAACGDDTDPKPDSAPSSSKTSADEASTPLEGTWTAGTITCAMQLAALDAAGFTHEEVAQGLGTDDIENCPPYEIQLKFTDDRLVIFMNGDVGWDGEFAVGADGTFRAGDQGPAAGLYATYAYELDADTLTIDLLKDDMPTSPDELVGELVNQTFIYESAPFTRVG
jgi:hypothetical protein